LIPLTPLQRQGQGVGATFTTLFLQGADPSTTESGGVLFNGSVFGDAGGGASPSRTFTFADLAISSPSQLGLLINLAEPGAESPPSVTTALSPLATNANLANTITLNVYSAAGVLLEQHVAASGLTLNQVASGLGGSDLLFVLAATEQAQLAATMAANAGNEMFTVGATFANRTGRSRDDLRGPSDHACSRARDLRADAGRHGRPRLRRTEAPQQELIAHRDANGLDASRPFFISAQ
jgi:hypothetical protein